MLVKDVEALLVGDTQAADLLGLGPFEDFPDLIGALFTVLCSEAVGRIAAKTYRETPAINAATERDIAETARRNFEPGGPAAVLLFSRGAHATIAHRVAHRLWQNGDTTAAMAVKAACGRAFATDIHPAAQIGAGFWLDHGLGFVAGETTVIPRLKTARSSVPGPWCLATSPLVQVQTSGRGRLSWKTSLPAGSSSAPKHAISAPRAYPS